MYQRFEGAWHFLSADDYGHISPTEMDTTSLISLTDVTEFVINMSM
jgi:hypothetical protein